MSIETELRGWDGKSVAVLGEMFARHADAPGFAADLVRLSMDAACQDGATWLLKAWLESGRGLSAAGRRELFDGLAELVSWRARLHVLQCLPYIAIESEDKAALEAFARGAIADDNKFVRAWGYNGFYLLARRYPQYREEARRFFAMAMRDEPASVRARVRAILRQGF